jgi:hypothetical protein
MEHMGASPHDDIEDPEYRSRGWDRDDQLASDGPLPVAHPGGVTEHPNVALVRRLIRAFRDRDLDSIHTLTTSDLIWHFPGRSGRLAGDHRGRDEALQFLVDVVALTTGSFDFDVIDVLANDRRAVVLFRGRATREGRELDNPTCLSMKLRAGQIVELWEFVWNLYAVDEFWS